MDSFFGLIASFSDISVLEWMGIMLFVVISMFFLREKIGNPYPNPLMKQYARLPASLIALRSIRALLLGLIAILIVIIVDEKARNENTMNTEARERSTVIALDISKSMETDDLSPSRMEYAKGILLEYLPKLRDLGLVIFAGKTFVLSPISSDARGLGYLIDTLSTDTIDQSQNEISGTNIGDALIQASSLFDAKTKEKNIVLITDGRANIGLDPLIATEALKNEGIKLSILALGSTTDIALNHLVNGRREPLLDASGNTINGSVDLDMLTRMSAVTSGELIIVSKGQENTDLTPIFPDSVTPGTSPGVEKIDEKTLSLLIAYLGVIHFILTLFLWHRYKSI